METAIYEGYEYRMQGGEVHRRPVDRQMLHPLDAAWLVLNHGERVPPEVLPAIIPADCLRFD